MKLRPFELERYFAAYEFTARYLLGSSDPESMPVQDLLALEPDSTGRLGELQLGYTHSRGSPQLRRAIASLYEHGDKERILVHSGAQEPIFAFMNVALAPGDHVVVQCPAYQSHYSIAEAAGARVTRWNSDLAREGAPDFDELERLIRPATRAIVLTTPNNPTGYPFDRKQNDAVVDVARRHGLWLFVDEVYRGLEREAERIPAACDLYERGISLGAMAKAYGLAGLRSDGSRRKTDRSTSEWLRLRIISRSATAHRASFSPSWRYATGKRCSHAYAASSPIISVVSTRFF